MLEQIKYGNKIELLLGTNLDWYYRKSSSEGDASG